jgi:hypothetical protein
MISEERRGERKHREGKKSPLKINHHASIDTSQTIKKSIKNRIKKQIKIKRLMSKFDIKIK